MTQTQAKFEKHNMVNFRSTKEFLHSIGFPLYKNNLFKTRFKIEIKKEPNIITQVKHSNFFKNNYQGIWIIKSITKNGIVLTLINNNYIFIPFHQILSINTVDSNLLARLMDKKSALNV